MILQTVCLLFIYFWWQPKFYFFGAGQAQFLIGKFEIYFAKHFLLINNMLFEKVNIQVSFRLSDKLWLGQSGCSFSQCLVFLHHIFVSNRWFRYILLNIFSFLYEISWQRPMSSVNQTIQTVTTYLSVAKQFYSFNSQN